MGGGAGLGHGRGGRDLQHQVRARLHAAGQHVAVGRLGRRQRVLEVGPAVELAGLAERLAGPAGAVPAVQRDVDP